MLLEKGGCEGSEFLLSSQPSQLVDRESSAQRVPTGRSPVAQDPSLTEEES